MTDFPAYDPLLPLTRDNRSLIERAGVGVCLACHAISPCSLIVSYRDDSAVCPQCGRTAVVPAWTTALLDDVAGAVYGVAAPSPDRPSEQDSEDATTTAIHGEILPLMTRIEQRTGQKLMPPLWAALTRALASLGATEDQLKQGVEVQVRSQQELGRRRKH
jgi:hypothetical protein